MSSGAKKGALGVAAMLGLIGVRSADNCAGVAARGARVAGDDIVSVGARAGDDIAEAGARAGSRGRGVQWGATPRAGVRPPVAASEEGLLETLAEGGVEVGLEVLRFDAPPSDIVESAPSGVACPVPHDLTLEPEAWSKYLDGFGIACAPAVFIARAQGDALVIDGTAAPLATLAKSCADAGGVCFFVGCEGQGRCFGDATRASHGVGLRLELEPYILALANHQLREAKPAWVAYSLQPGVLSVLRRGDVAVSPPP